MILLSANALLSDDHLSPHNSGLEALIKVILFLQKFVTQDYILSQKETFLVTHRLRKCVQKYMASDPEEVGSGRNVA